MKLVDDTACSGILGKKVTLEKLSEVRSLPKRSSGHSSRLVA